MVEPERLDLGAPQGVYTVVNDLSPTTGISVDPDDLVTSPKQTVA